MRQNFTSRSILTIRTISALAVAFSVVVTLPGPDAAAVDRHPVAAAHAHSEHDPSAAHPLRYVALGSSYAAGADSSDVVDAGCLRTGDNYPHRVADALHLSLTDVTCSRSTIANVLSRPQRGRADAPQIDAVGADTDLVTITTGGNDVGYIGRLTDISCADRVGVSDTPDALPCRDGHPGRTPTAADFARVRLGLIRIVDAVRARAPRAVVMIVDYPPVIDAGGDLCPAVPLTPAEAASTVRTFAELTSATAAAAAAGGATLVDVATPGFAHTACSSSPWVYGDRLPAPYHPDAAGRAAMAALTVDAIDASGLLSR